MHTKTITITKFAFIRQIFPVISSFTPGLSYLDILSQNTQKRSSGYGKSSQEQEYKADKLVNTKMLSYVSSEFCLVSTK